MLLANKSLKKYVIWKKRKKLIYLKLAKNKMCDQITVQDLELTVESQKNNNQTEVIINSLKIPFSFSFDHLPKKIK